MNECGSALADITIRFPGEEGTKDTVVRPQDSDIRAQQRHFARAQFEFPEDAGAIIDEATRARSLAFVEINDIISQRMMVPRDALSFESNLDNETVAKLDLLDALYVLDNQTVDKKLVEADFEDLVEKIVSYARDPEDVIQDVKLVTADNSGYEVPVSFEWIEAIDESIKDLFDGKAQDIARDIMPVPDEMEVDLSEHTLLSGLMSLVEEPALSAWVGVDGTLFVGIDGTRGQVLGTATTDDDFIFSRYTVTRSARTISEVVVEGATLTDREANWVKGEPNRHVAVARAPDINGATLYVKSDTFPDVSKSSLKKIAAARLYQEVTGAISGSIEINGLASEATGALAHLDIGDYFYVHDSITDECNQEMQTGLFVVTGVHHRAGPRRGWSVRLDVSRIPDPSLLEQNVVNVEVGQNYDNISALYAKATGHEYNVTIDGFDIDVESQPFEVERTQTGNFLIQ